MIKIDKNIPIPEVQKGRNIIYPFSNMEIGDSFLIPFEDAKFIQPGMVRVREAVYRAQKKFRFNFAIRKVENGIRVWRVG